MKARPRAPRQKNQDFCERRYLCRRSHHHTSQEAMATQELEQSICQKFGWSARYFKICDKEDQNDGCWAVEVTTALDCRQTFVSNDKSSDTTKGRKTGKRAAAQVALEGLKPTVERELKKPIVRGLNAAMGYLFAETRIVESSPAIWREFWSNPPDAVGVDVEGNSLTPPVLVQIATDDLVILEIPSQVGLSIDLQRLLDDESIIKVLCDCPSRRDANSLGLPVRPDIVDLEVLASSQMGKTNVPRGLSNLLCLTIPVLAGIRISKANGSKRLKDIGTFTSIEQGVRPRLGRMQDLTRKEIRYAALDAWCTLQIYRHLTTEQVL